MLGLPSQPCLEIANFHTENLAYYSLQGVDVGDAFGGIVQIHCLLLSSVGTDILTLRFTSLKGKPTWWGWENSGLVLVPRIHEKLLCKGWWVHFGE